MKCIETDKMVIAYLEGSLGEDKSMDFKKHLDECAECREYVDFVRLSIDTILTDRHVREGALRPEKIIAQLVPAGIAGIKRRMATQVAAAAAVIIFAVFTGLELGRFTSSVQVYHGSSIENDILFAGDISLEPIESYFIINE